jgi:hypothetical protein
MRAKITGEAFVHQRQHLFRDGRFLMAQAFGHLHACFGRLAVFFIVVPLPASGFAIRFHQYRCDLRSSRLARAV